MTNDEQKVAIAEACGFTQIIVETFDFGSLVDVFFGIPPGEKTRVGLPNYTDDLMDVSKAVAFLTEKFGWSFQQPYTESLKRIVERRRHGLNSTQLFYWVAEANAAQRAEAICDTLAIMEALTPA